MRSAVHLLAMLIVAFAFGWTTTFIAWDELRGNAFTDVINYNLRIERIRQYGMDVYLDDFNPIKLLSREPLWASLIEFGVYLGVDTVSFLKIITFFTAAIAFLFVAPQLGNVWAFALLLNPISIDLYNSQARAALAFSLIIVGYAMWVRGGLLRVLAFGPVLASLLTHTSMTIVVAFLALSLGISNIALSPRSRNLICFAIAVSAAYAFVLLGNELLSYAADRRVISEFAVRSASYLAIWLLIGLLFVFQFSIKFSTNPVGLYSILVLTFSVLSELLGMTAFRLVAVSLPFIFSSFALVADRARLAVLMIALLYNFILFSYWLA